ncbi:MAG: 3-deoxy-manno-octulosonate cytidylyltransferase [Pirellulales bacterium]
METAKQAVQGGASSFIVIPARLASTRLPRKLLLRETGKTLIQHTYEAAATARRPSGLCVATDHEDIFNAVRAFGGAVEMTSADCASGTDRVAEVARCSRLVGTGIDIVVNVQGDEPELPGSSIDAAIAVLEADPGVRISTLAAPIRKREQLLDPSCVKVVFDASGRAMYFSRSPIPHAREWQDELLAREPPCFYQHIGLYAYRRDFLLELAAIPASRLEQLEKLEQLRFLEAGQAIAVAVVEKATPGIDTPHDYRAFVDRVLAR